MHEIVAFDSPALREALDIFQASFPLREQMPFSWWIEYLVEKSQGRAERRHLVASLQDGRVAVFAYFEEDARADYLWYLASRPDIRGRGAGAALLDAIKRRAFERDRPLLIEAELPDEAAKSSAEEGEWARRRISWYRRQGAMLLGGIRYIQKVGWQPPFPMGLMVASPGDISPAEAFDAASSSLGEDIEQIGPLTLD
jgi:GNAT superfamily N-acetyltransferase